MTIYCKIKKYIVYFNGKADLRHNKTPKGVILVSKKNKIEKEQAPSENTQAVENAETAEGETKNASFKAMITKCIAAVVCAGIVCGSAIAGTEKYTSAKVKVAELTPVTVAANANGGSYNAPASSDTDTSGTSYNEDTGDAADTSTDIDVVEPVVDGGDTSTGNDTTKAPASASEMSKAQIITLFNNAANNAKKGAKSIHQNYAKNTQVSGIELNNKMLASLADKLIAANMGEDEAKHDKTYTGGDKAGYFPVAGQQWASKLTEADVKSATVTEKNGVYSVVIKLLDDTQKNPKVGEGHTGKAFSLVTKEQIVEGAGSAGMAVIKEESIKVGHSGGVIKATIDKDGKLKTANYYRVWKLELTALGIDVGISFGIEEDYNINW